MSLQSSLTSMNTLVDANLKYAMNNEWARASMHLLIVLYAARLAPNLPKPVTDLFANTYFKLFVFFVILVTTRTQPSTALLIAVAFLVVSTYANTGKFWEGFTTFTAPIVGRYVRIEHTDNVKDRILNVSGLYVYDANQQNQAAGKPTRSSSVHLDREAYSASKLVDGADTFAHTKAQQNPWLEVDLGSDVNIHRIVIQNRIDCCRDRIVGARVRVINAAGNVTYTSPAIKKVDLMYEIIGTCPACPQTACPECRKTECPVCKDCATDSQVNNFTKDESDRVGQLFKENKFSGFQTSFQIYSDLTQDQIQRVNAVRRMEPYDKYLMAKVFIHMFRQAVHIGGPDDFTNVAVPMLPLLHATYDNMDKNGNTLDISREFALILSAEIDKQKRRRK